MRDQIIQAQSQLMRYELKKLQVKQEVAKKMGGVEDVEQEV